jgi:transcriptional regulator with XRE-family HTH domain
MKLGDVVKKERERKKLTAEDVAARLNVTPNEYSDIEAGASPAEVWGPRLALIAIALKVPTSRLIAETGKSRQAAQVSGQCGKLIRAKREDRGLSHRELAEKIEVQLSDVESIENGDSPLEHYAPLLLAFAETIDQPIFNLFYPCGLPLDKLTDYP